MRKEGRKMGRKKKVWPEEVWKHENLPMRVMFDEKSPPTLYLEFGYEGALVHFKASLDGFWSQLCEYMNFGLDSGERGNRAMFENVARMIEKAKELEDTGDGENKRILIDMLVLMQSRYRDEEVTVSSSPSPTTVRVIGKDGKSVREVRLHHGEQIVIEPGEEVEA